MFHSSSGSRSVAARASLLLAVALCLGVSSPSLAADDATPKPQARATTEKKKAPAQAKSKSKTQVDKKAQAKGEAQADKKAQAKTKPEKITAPRLSVAEIVRRHVSARGGLESWRGVQALSLSGKMEAGTGDSVARSMRIVEQKRKGQRVVPAATPSEDKQVQLPFTLAKARPNKSRLEIQFAGKTAVQVYDGTNGWKVRPFLNRNDVEPFTPEEAKAQAEGDDLADPLIDYAAKGTKVELAAIEKVEGRDAYKLALTSAAGTKRHVWIDAKSFLDVKVQGAPRRMDGKLHDVFVYQRDFRAVQGVKVPFVLETAVDGYPQRHKILVEKVAVNPKLGGATFAKPKA